MATTNYHALNGEIIGETTGASRTGYLTDGLGSVTATQGSTGNVLATYRYKPYGTLLAKTGAGSDPRFLWTGAGGSRVSHLLQYNRYRSYSPLIALWISRDPLWPIEPGAIYAKAAPTQNVDPMGLFTESAYVCKKHRRVTGYEIRIGADDARGISSGVKYKFPHCQSHTQALDFCKSAFQATHKGRVVVVNGSFFISTSNCTPVSPVTDCQGGVSGGDKSAHAIDVRKGAVQYTFGKNLLWGRRIWLFASGSTGSCNDNMSSNSSTAPRTVLVEQGSVTKLYVLGGATHRQVCDCFPHATGGKTLNFDGGGSTQAYIEQGGQIKSLIASGRKVSNFFWVREREAVKVGGNEEPI